MIIEQKIWHRHWIDKVAILNAFISSFALYPQLFVLLTSGDGKENLSITTFSVIFLTSIIWLWYGIHRKTFPIIISSFLNGAAAGGIVLLIY